MTINERLLQEAFDAEERLAAAERNLQSARTEFHSIVRRMHLSGGSCREIAQALRLSHQRVQQMVRDAGGSWWKRVWRQRRLQGNLICTFCGRSQNEVARLIAGPKVFICEMCVANAEQNRVSQIRAHHGVLVRARENSRARCSFCGKGNTNERELLTGPTGNICGECLRTCSQILADSAL